MKTRNIANYVIAIAVITCSLVLCSTLVFAVTGFRLQGPSRTIQIDFKNVTGISEGTAVMYAGRSAGTVIELRHLTQEERRESGHPDYVVRVTLEIDEGIPALTSDVRSGVGSESFLGGKFVALHPGTVTAPQLTEGTVLRTTETDFMDVVQNVGENLDTIVSKLSTDYQDLVPQIASLLERTGNMVSAGTNLVDNLNGVVGHAQDLAAQLKTDYRSSYNPRISSILDQVQTIGTNVNVAVQDVNTNVTQTLNNVSTLVEGNRTNLTEVIAELRVVSQNLKVISTYSKALTGRLGQKPSRLIWSKKQDLPSEEEIISSKDPIPVPLTGGKEEK